MAPWRQSRGSASLSLPRGSESRAGMARTIARLSGARRGRAGRGKAAGRYVVSVGVRACTAAGRSDPAHHPGPGRAYLEAAVCCWQRSVVSAPGRAAHRQWSESGRGRPGPSGPGDHWHAAPCARGVTVQVVPAQGHGLGAVRAPCGRYLGQGPRCRGAARAHGWVGHNLQVGALRVLRSVGQPPFLGVCWPAGLAFIFFPVVHSQLFCFIMPSG